MCAQGGGQDGVTGLGLLGQCRGERGRATKATSGNLSGHQDKDESEKKMAMARVRGPTERALEKP